MFEFLSDPAIAQSFQAVACSPAMWGLTLLGVTLGMIVGVLPGFGPPAAMALLFPLTYVLPPLPAISLLAGIFYGAKYGGAVTSILLGIPGETDAVVTLFEGFPLARAGKARQALRAAAFASFVGAMTALLGMVLLAPLLSAMALYLGPAGRFLLIAGALALISVLGQGAVRKNIVMVLLGLLLACVGMDSIHGARRLTFGSLRLMSGIDMTALLLGVFGIADVLDTLIPKAQSLPFPACGAGSAADTGRAFCSRNLLTDERTGARGPEAPAPMADRLASAANKTEETHPGECSQEKLAAGAPSQPKEGEESFETMPFRLLPAFFAALRGSVSGFATGLIPCGAGVTASFLSYTLERKISRCRGMFGKGVWEGLTGPEASNNAAAVASFAPLLLLGLPTNPIMAALLGALTVGGVVPGPSIMTDQAPFFWGLMFSLGLGNLMLLAMGIGLAGVWARVARIPYRFLYPPIVMLCLWGAYISSGLSGAGQCLILGVAGFFLRRHGYPAAPLVLAFALGPRLESHLAQALLTFL